jgi:hypothetical protein
VTEIGPERDETIRVKAPIEVPEIPIGSEVMSALPDPASDDQAVLLNAPFYIGGLNYGDIVRLGSPDDMGIRPIVEVLVASGHVRLIAVTGHHGVHELYDHLMELFPTYALRIEGDGESILSVSVHPDLDPDEVFDAIADWLCDHGHADDDDVAVSPVFETMLGPLSPTW